MSYSSQKRKTFLYRQVRSILGEAPLLTDCRQLGEAMPAAFNLGACVTVLGQGERGAVIFHPESLAFSVRLGEIHHRPSTTLISARGREAGTLADVFFTKG